MTTHKALMAETPAPHPAPALTPAQKERFDLLHAIKLKGRATDEALSHMLAAPREEAVRQREALAAEGLAIFREGRLPSTALTDDGRAQHAALLDAILTDTVKRDAIGRGLEDFHPINGDLKRVSSAWQTRPDGTPNAHDDAEYDASIVSDLSEVNARATALLRAAAPLEQRFGRYADRLDAALARLRAGESAAFLRPLSESYHDIWMELHEDLIVLSGRVRGDADEG